MLKGLQVGHPTRSPKKWSVAPRGSQDSPPEMEANLGLKTSIFWGQVDIHVGEGLGAPCLAQDRFFWGPTNNQKTSSVAPKGPQDTLQNGGQLRLQKIISWRLTWPPCWKGSWHPLPRPRSIFWGPTWPHVGLMLAVNMSPCWKATMDLCWNQFWKPLEAQKTLQILTLLEVNLVLK